jgi:hypothetical protein
MRFDGVTTYMYGEMDDFIGRKWKGIPSEPWGEYAD